jgi:hypothetical protein
LNVGSTELNAHAKPNLGHDALAAILERYCDCHARVFSLFFTTHNASCPSTKVIDQTAHGLFNKTKIDLTRVLEVLGPSRKSKHDSVRSPKLTVAQVDDNVFSQNCCTKVTSWLAEADVVVLVGTDITTNTTAHILKGIGGSISPTVIKHNCLGAEAGARGAFGSVRAGDGDYGATSDGGTSKLKVQQRHVSAIYNINHSHACKAATQLLQRSETLGRPILYSPSLSTLSSLLPSLKSSETAPPTASLPMVQTQSGTSNPILVSDVSGRCDQVLALLAWSLCRVCKMMKRVRGLSQATYADGTGAVTAPAVPQIFRSHLETTEHIADWTRFSGSSGSSGGGDGGSSNGCSYIPDHPILFEEFRRWETHQRLLLETEVEEEKSRLARRRKRALAAAGGVAGIVGMRPTDNSSDRNGSLHGGGRGGGSGFFGALGAIDHLLAAAGDNVTLAWLGVLRAPLALTMGCVYCPRRFSIPPPFCVSLPPFMRGFLFSHLCVATSPLLHSR